MSARGQPSPSTNGIKGIKNHPISTCSRTIEEHVNPPTEHRNRRHHDNNNSAQYNDTLQTYSNQNSHVFSKHPPSPDSRNHASANDNGVIYANHQMSFHSAGLGEHGSLQKRSPPMTNRSSAFYENQLLKNCHKDIQDVPHDDNAVYANQYIASSRHKSSPLENLHPLSSGFQPDCESSLSNFRSPQRNQHAPPPVAQKPRPALPQPSEMIMVTETRGWNGQVSSYPKDVVKPTPRMPRFANVASGTHLANVPAYQCVINELSSQNGQQQSLPRSSDSSTLSLRSGYDSSSSSVRDYGRQPSKSDSSIDMRKLSEGKVFFSLL